MYKFIYEHAARTFAYQKKQKGMEMKVFKSEGYWWAEYKESMPHFDCCNAPQDLGHMYGCPNSPENKVS